MRSLARQPTVPRLPIMCIETDADLVLLDVQMPGLSGLDVAGELARLEPPPAVILVTAYPEYALDGLRAQCGRLSGQAGAP
jgi:DNA-binding LytR/AlgR family response regulator